MSDLIDPQNIFVVIPAFNEQQSLQSVVDQLSDKNFHLVIVDDGSSDRIHPSLSEKSIFVLRHRVNLGQGAALQTGIEFALTKKVKYIVTFDADGQHHADDIEKMIGALIESNADIALGSRFMGQTNSVPFKRKLLLTLARYVNFIFTGMFLTDAHNGLRAMTADAAQKIRITENRMAHATQILSLIRKNRLRYVEVPVNVFYSEYSLRKGQTVMSSFRIFFDLLLNKIFR